MQKITTAAELKIAIQQLEYKQAEEWPLLKEQFLLTYEGLKPLNLIKNTFREFTSSLAIKDNLWGLTAGYLSKLLIIGASNNPIKKLLGALLELGISNIVSKNQDTIQSLVDKVIEFFNKNKENENFNEKSS